MSIAVDTLRFYERLKAKEMPDGAAKEIAEMFKETTEGMSAELATKSDIKRDLQELEVAFKRDIQELELRLKHDLTLRLGGMVTAAVAITAVMVKLL